ncbi:hypothetical protein KQH81_07965 [Clostridium cadaveris]|uniref:hypothetical protein n=1 Tax=Clostridium cadaveris TaxID=1529 RepID=UPI001E52A372|nr:hypothetical protein [Clostridium cadaveris]UFH66446.1 hypothetical protein KQH81_07965 [Clostridium cadaveris]
MALVVLKINICGYEIKEKLMEACKNYIHILLRLKDKDNITLEELIEYHKAEIKYKTEKELYNWYIDKIKNDYKRLVYI